MSRAERWMLVLAVAFFWVLIALEVPPDGNSIFFQLPLIYESMAVKASGLLRHMVASFALGELPLAALMLWGFVIIAMAMAAMILCLSQAAWFVIPLRTRQWLWDFIGLVSLAPVLPKGWELCVVAMHENGYAFNQETSAYIGIVMGIFFGIQVAGALNFGHLGRILFRSRRPARPTPPE